MENASEIVLKPIGYIQNEIKKKGRHDWEQVKSTIIIDPNFIESMDGLEGFSHIILLFWMHRNTGEFPAKVHPQRREDLPAVGVFASRSPHRPNNIGLAVAKLLEHKENILRVTGLDAIDGTPVLDIKPYLPSELIPDAKYPEWVSKLHQKKPL